MLEYRATTPPLSLPRSIVLAPLPERRRCRRALESARQGIGAASARQVALKTCARSETSVQAGLRIRRPALLEGAVAVVHDAFACLRPRMFVARPRAATVRLRDFQLQFRVQWEGERSA